MPRSAFCTLAAEMSDADSFWLSTGVSVGGGEEVLSSTAELRTRKARCLAGDTREEEKDRRVQSGAGGDRNPTVAMRADNREVGAYNILNSPINLWYFLFLNKEIIFIL